MSGKMRITGYSDADSDGSDSDVTSKKDIKPSVNMDEIEKRFKALETKPSTKSNKSNYVKDIIDETRDTEKETQWMIWKLHMNTYLEDSKNNLLNKI